MATRIVEVHALQWLLILNEQYEVFIQRVEL